MNQLATEGRTEEFPMTLGLSVSIVLSFWMALNLNALGIAQTNLPLEDREAPRNTIIEAPMGPVDGQNPSFTLRLLPISSTDVAITVNGTRVRQGPELSVCDQKVLFYPPAIPKSGDLIRATYATQLTSVADRPSNITSMITPLATAALMRMVEAEVISNANPESTRVRFLTPPSQAGQVTRESAVRSLPMLAQILATAGPHTSAAANDRAEDELRSLIGVEGTGDNPPASPYEALFRDDQHGRRARSTSGGDNPSLTKGAPLPRSLEMLRQAIERGSSK